MRNPSRLLGVFAFFLATAAAPLSAAQKNPAGFAAAPTPQSLSAAWENVLNEIGPCFVPGEKSCADMTAYAVEVPKASSLTPLDAFSGNVARAGDDADGNNPEKVAAILAPTISQKPSLNPSEKPPIVSLEDTETPSAQNLPKIKGGNGTFKAMPQGVERANQIIGQTAPGLSGSEKQ